MSKKKKDIKEIASIKSQKNNLKKASPRCCIAFGSTGSNKDSNPKDIKKNNRKKKDKLDQKDNKIKKN